MWEETDSSAATGASCGQSHRRRWREGCAQVVLYHIKGEARPGSTSCVRCRCFIALSNLCYFISQNSAF